MHWSWRLQQCQIWGLKQWCSGNLPFFWSDFKTYAVNKGKAPSAESCCPCCRLAGIAVEEDTAACLKLCLEKATAAARTQLTLSLQATLALLAARASKAWVHKVMLLAAARQEQTQRGSSLDRNLMILPLTVPSIIYHDFMLPENDCHYCHYLWHSLSPEKVTILLLNIQRIVERIAEYLEGSMDDFRLAIWRASDFLRKPWKQARYPKHAPKPYCCACDECTVARKLPGSCLGFKDSRQPALLEVLWLHDLKRADQNLWEFNIAKGSHVVLSSFTGFTESHESRLT